MELTPEQVGRAILAGACPGTENLVGESVSTLSPENLNWAEEQGIILEAERDAIVAEAIPAEAGIVFGDIPLEWLSDGSDGSDGCGGDGDGYGGDGYDGDGYGGDGYGDGGYGDGYAYGSGGSGYGYGGYGYGSGDGDGWKRYQKSMAL